MNIKPNNKILSFLKIKPNELNKLLLLFFFSFFIGSSTNIIEGLSYSFFNIKIGPDYLPNMFILLTFVMIGATFLITYIMGHKNKPLLIILFFSALGVIVLFNSFFLITGLSEKFSKLFYSWFFLCSGVTDDIFRILWTIIVAELCSTQQGKRLLPLITAGYFSGLIFGGLNLRFGPLFIGTEYIYLGTLALIVLNVKILSAIKNKYWIIESDSKSKIKQVTTKDNIKYFKSSSIIKFITFMSISAYALFFIFQLNFNITAKINYPNELNLVQYFGLYKTISSILSFGFVLFILNRLILKIGVWNLSLLTPLSFAVGFLLYAIAGQQIILSTLSMILIDVFFLSAASTYFPLLFKPTKPEHRQSIMTISNFIGSTSGTVMCYVFGLILTKSLLTFNQFSIFMFIISFIIFTIILFQRRIYFKSLSEAVLSHKFDLLENPLKYFGKMNKKINITFYKKYLKPLSVSSKTVILNLLSKFTNISKHYSDELMLLLQSKDTSTQIHTLDMLSNQSDLPKNMLDYISDNIHSKNTVVNILVLKILYKNEPDNYYNKLNNEITEILNSDILENKIFAVKLIGELKLNEFLKNLSKMLSTEKNILNKEVIKSISSFKEVDDKNLIQQLIANYNNFNNELNNEIINCLSNVAFKYDDYFADLLISNNLNNWSVAVNYFVKRNNLKYYELIYNSSLINIFQMYENLFAIHKLNEIKKFEGIQLIIDKLNSNNDLIIETCFKFLAMKSDAVTINAVFKHLHSNDDHIKMNAIEILDNIGDKKIVKYILPFYENDVDSTINTAINLFNKHFDITNVLNDLLSYEEYWIKSVTVYSIGELISLNIIEVDNFLEKIKCYSESENVLLKDISKKTIYKINFFMRIRNNNLGVDNIMNTNVNEKNVLDKILFLKKVKIFNNIPPDLLTGLVYVSLEKDFDKDERILSKDEISSAVHIILHGEVIFKETNKKLSVNDYFGEMSVLTNKPELFTVIATKPTKVMLINNTEFNYFIEKNPIAAKNIITDLYERLR